MGMNDENEVIKLSCANVETCGKSIEGTYKDLFGGLPSLRLLPKMVCSECGGDIELQMTGNFKITYPTRGFESDMAYPQYKSKYGSHIIISTKGWRELQEYVLKLKCDKWSTPLMEVKKHWDSILSGVVPFGMRISNESKEETKKP